MDALTAMFTERPYVLAFLASFLIVAWAERGWQRMLFWLASGTFFGWLMEFSSTHTAFPFGAYAYHEANFPDELFIGGVPVFASLSFAFLTYFGYSAACTMLSPLRRRGNDLERVDDSRIEGSIAALALAALLTTWADTVIDPVSLLGKHWFLGDLYHYKDAGIHFGVPLANYGGWLFTTALIVFVNQRFDALLRVRGVASRGFALPLLPLWSVGALLGDFVFMLSITVYLMAADRAPGEPLGSILASGLALTAAFVAVTTFMLRRGLERGREATDFVETPPATGQTLRFAQGDKGP